MYIECQTPQINKKKFNMLGDFGCVRVCICVRCKKYMQCAKVCKILVCLRALAFEIQIGGLVSILGVICSPLDCILLVYIREWWKQMCSFFFYSVSASVNGKCKFIEIKKKMVGRKWLNLCNVFLLTKLVLYI